MPKQKQACRFASEEPEVLEGYDYPQSSHGGASSSSGRGYNNNIYDDGGYGSSNARAGAAPYQQEEEEEEQYQQDVRGGVDYDIYRPGRGRGGMGRFDDDGQGNGYDDEDPYMGSAAGTPDGRIFDPGSDIEEFLGETGKALSSGASALASGAASAAVLGVGIAAVGATAAAGLAKGAAEEGAHLAGLGANLVAARGAEAAAGARRREEEMAKAAQDMATTAKGKAAGLRERAKQGFSSLGSMLEHGMEDARHGLAGLAHHAQEDAQYVADQAKELARGAKARAQHDAECLEEALEHGAEDMAYVALHGVEDVSNKAHELEAAALANVKKAKGQMKESMEGARAAARLRAEQAEQFLEHGVEDAAYLALHGADDVRAAALGVARGLEQNISEARHAARDRLEHLSEEAQRRRHLHPNEGPKKGSREEEKSTSVASPNQVDQHSSKDPVPKRADGLDVIDLARGVPLESATDAGKRRLRVTVLGARDLPLDEGEGATVMCRCEVRGKPSTSFECAWAPAQSELMWNEQREMSCLPTDALVFVLRAQDPAAGSLAVQLAQVTLFINEIPPRGLRKSLPLGLGGASLDVCINCLGAPPAEVKTPVSSAVGQTPVVSTSGSSSPLSLVPTKRPDLCRGLSVATDTARLRLVIRSASGVASALAGHFLKASDCQVAVAVLGTVSGRQQTGGAKGGQDDLFWNSQLEFPNYPIGCHLEFSLISSGSPRPELAQGTLKAEQFVPFGFDASVTLLTPGRGISGILSIKAELVKDPKPSPPGVQAGLAARPEVVSNGASFTALAPQTVAAPAAVGPGAGYPLVQPATWPATPAFSPGAVPGSANQLARSWPALPGSVSPFPSPAPSFLAPPLPTSMPMPVPTSSLSPSFSARVLPPQLQQQPPWSATACPPWQVPPSPPTFGSLSGPSLPPTPFAPLGSAHVPLAPGPPFVQASPGILIF